MTAALTPLWAVVEACNRSRVIAETGAPFDAATYADALSEVVDTYGDVVAVSGWAVVPLTPELESQYDKEAV